MGGSYALGWKMADSSIGFVENDTLYVKQLGVYMVTYTYSGADPVTYTYTLKFAKTTTALNYMYSNCLNSPNSNNAIATIPKNATVSITQVGYSNYGVWGKCTYNGKTGWIILLKYQ